MIYEIKIPGKGFLVSDSPPTQPEDIEWCPVHGWPDFYTHDGFPWDDRRFQYTKIGRVFCRRCDFDKESPDVVVLEAMHVGFRIGQRARDVGGVLEALQDGFELGRARYEQLVRIGEEAMTQFQKKQGGA